MGNVRDGTVPSWFQSQLDELLRELPDCIVDHALRSSSISVESSHCFERTRHPEDEELNNTKAAFVRNLIEQNPTVPIYSTRTLQEDAASTSLQADKSNLGEVVWYYCLQQLKQSLHVDSADCWKCNIAAIREPGVKVRIVTSSSYLHAGFLQPYSKIFLKVLEYWKEVASGVSDSDHLWRFYQRFNNSWVESFYRENSEAKQVGVSPNYKGKLWTGKYRQTWFSSDLTEATDNCYRSIGRYVVFRLCQRLGLSEEAAKFVADVYAHDRIGVVHIPSLDEKGNTIMVPYEYPIRSGILMGDPLTKVVMTFCQLATIREVQRVTNDRDMIASAVGDDIAIVSGSSQTPRLYQKYISQLGYLLSEPDTIVSRFALIYAERAMVQPLKVQHLAAAMRYASPTKTAVVDILKTRLVFDFRKDREDFSFTPEGRITQLYRETVFFRIQNQKDTSSWNEKRQCLDIRVEEDDRAFTIAETIRFIQFVVLDASRKCPWVFLPKIVGGSDIPVPFFSLQLFDQLAYHWPTNFAKLFRYGIKATLMTIHNRQANEFLLFIPKPCSYPWRDPGKAPRMVMFQDQLIYHLQNNYQSHIYVDITDPAFLHEACRELHHTKVWYNTGDLLSLYNRKINLYRWLYGSVGLDDFLESYNLIDIPKTKVSTIYGSCASMIAAVESYLGQKPDCYTTAEIEEWYKHLKKPGRKSQLIWADIWVSPFLHDILFAGLLGTVVRSFQELRKSDLVDQHPKERLNGDQVMIYNMVVNRNFEFTPQGISSDEVLIQQTLTFIQSFQSDAKLPPYYIALSSNDNQLFRKICQLVLDYCLEHSVQTTVIVFTKDTGIYEVTDKSPARRKWTYPPKAGSKDPLWWERLDPVEAYLIAWDRWDTDNDGNQKIPHTDFLELIDEGTINT